MITISGLTVRYGEHNALPNIDLDVKEGEFLTLLGPSGCGKSTLLRTIAGFVTPTAGRIAVAGRDVTKLAPEERGLGFVFQSYALFPHLTVEENVAFGLKVRRLPRMEVRDKVAAALAKTGLSRFAQRHPADLSGGQQQRVAIARVLVTDPTVILMDEPLSNLDASLRSTLRAEISRMHRELGVTTLYVTHDQEEAMALSDRVAVMSEGLFLQIGTPSEIYHRPATREVCTFVGASNLLSPELAHTLGHVNTGDAYVRPERVRLGASAGASGIVIERTFFGPTTELRVRIGTNELRVMITSDGAATPTVGDTVRCTVDPDDFMVFPV